MFPLLDFCDRRIFILSFAQKKNKQLQFFSSFFGQCDISVKRLHHVHSNKEIGNYRFVRKRLLQAVFLNT